ncbi:MAG: type II toxin-antitoxin system death-on-curing family toxin [Mycobacteriales bacterium]
MRFLDLADVRAVGLAVLDRPMEVREWGLVASALARPQATVFGSDAYATLWEKAAALLHSLVRNHALVDGNKPVGFTCAILLLYKNGQQVEYTEDEAYDLVIAVAEGVLEVPAIAASVAGWAVVAAQ